VLGTFSQKVHYYNSLQTFFMNLIIILQRCGEVFAAMGGSGAGGELVPLQAVRDAMAPCTARLQDLLKLVYNKYSRHSLTHSLVTIFLPFRF
jgi:hypothetical protein